MDLKEQLQKDLEDLMHQYQELLQATQRQIGAIAYIRDVLQKMDAKDAEEHEKRVQAEIERKAAQRDALVSKAIEVELNGADTVEDEYEPDQVDHDAYLVDEPARM